MILRKIIIESVLKAFDQRAKTSNDAIEARKQELYDQWDQHGIDLLKESNNPVTGESYDQETIAILTEYIEEVESFEEKLKGLKYQGLTPEAILSAVKVMNLVTRAQKG